MSVSGSHIDAPSRSLVEAELSVVGKSRFSADGGFSEAIVRLWLKVNSSEPVVLAFVKCWLNHTDCSAGSAMNAAAYLMNEVADQLPEMPPIEYEAEQKSYLRLEEYLKLKDWWQTHLRLQYSLDKYRGQYVIIDNAGNVLVGPDKVQLHRHGISSPIIEVVFYQTRIGYETEEEASRSQKV